MVGTYFPESDKIDFDGAKVLWQGTSCFVKVMLLVLYGSSDP